MLNCKIQFSVALLLYTTLLCSLLFSTVATQIPLDSRIIVADNTNWVSSNEDFAIGFFQHSEQPNQYSVGIHFNSSSIPIDKQTVVWVAGAEIVVNNGSSFHLTANGELQQYIAQLLLLFINEKVGLGSSIPSTETGKGKSKVSKHVTHGYYCVKGKSHHPMGDYAFAQFREVDDNELDLFAIFDGHLSNHVPDYLESNLFENILN